MISWRRRSSYRPWWVFAIAVSVSTAVGLALFVGAYTRVIHRAFEERSTAYVQALAATVRPWIERGDPSMLEAAAQFFLVGSALYVQVSDGSQLLIEERTAAFEGVAFAQPLPAQAALVVQPDRTRDGRPYLDIIVRWSDSLSPDAGFTRVGIDRSSAVLQARNADLIAIGSGIVFVSLILWIARWGVRRVPTSSEPSEAAAGADAETRQLIAGRLIVDPSRKLTTFRGHTVRLTPKQFSVLSLLAKRPGHVWSEREILDAAWPDSPYADSKDIKQYIYLIRRRLSAIDPAARDLIVTVPGFGYRLAEDLVDPELTVRPLLEPIGDENVESSGSPRGAGGKERL